MGKQPGVSDEFHNANLDRIARILAAREYTIDVEVAVLRLQRQGRISRAEATQLLDWLQAIRIGLAEGQTFGKWVISHPPDLGGA